ncbi:hypothetical protein BBF96_10220 [Anoxybacter fermentans]|uniref:Uncharacterized protein n=1 Tax=Anoxybacter fermentans TaxID=1323375 RepID=A0A3S9SZG5_9FIRM|nr:tetratricopeptide repeat protein [Anoxybacter fermentans]AZR73726.1 hypothetical protein BBF96_10220 [Anoxybacter fermentans]
MENIEPYLEKAKQSLEEKDFKRFIENIVIAKHLTKSYTEYRPEVLYQYAIGLYKLGDYKGAYEEIEEAIVVQEPEKKYNLIKIKGIILGKLGALEDAVQIFERLSKLDEYPRIKIGAINNLAWVYVYLFKQKSDSEFLKKAIEKCNSLITQFNLFDDNDLRGKVLINLGTVYWYQKNFKESLDVFNEALKYVKDHPRLFNNLASVYVQLGETEKAYEFIDKAELIADRTKNYFEKAQSYVILAELSEYNEDYLRAIDYYQVALDHFISVQAPLEIYECFDNILRLQAKINRESIKLMKENFKNKVLNSLGEEIHLKLDFEKEVI